MAISARICRNWALRNQAFPLYESGIYISLEAGTLPRQVINRFRQF
jgi:hypothetical protein